MTSPGVLNFVPRLHPTIVHYRRRLMLAWLLGLLPRYNHRTVGIVYDVRWHSAKRQSPESTAIMGAEYNTIGVLVMGDVHNGARRVAHGVHRAAVNSSFLASLFEFLAARFAQFVVHSVQALDFLHLRLGEHHIGEVGIGVLLRIRANIEQQDEVIGAEHMLQRPLERELGGIGCIERKDDLSIIVTDRLTGACTCAAKCVISNSARVSPATKRPRRRLVDQVVISNSARVRRAKKRPRCRLVAGSPCRMSKSKWILLHQKLVK